MAPMSSLEPSGSELPTGKLPTTEPTSPSDLDGAYARYLTMSRAELVALTPEPGTLHQTGGAHLPGPFVVEPLELSEPITDSLIETFVIDGDGHCSATGTDDSLNAQWMPAVSAMASKVIAELALHQVSIDWPAYLTASLTRIDQVTTTPHFDNDQFIPNAGVDVVAIAANYDGTRMATSPITSSNPRPGLPVTLDQAESARFLDGTMATQQAAPDRIVIFPQFGQLHGGPILDRSRKGGPHPSPNFGPTRNLLVFRASTKPG